MQDLSKNIKGQQASKDRFSGEVPLCPKCPAPKGTTTLIWVHGHYQCTNCKTVVISCCEAN